MVDFPGMTLETIASFYSKSLETELNIGSQLMSQTFLLNLVMNLGFPHQGGVHFHQPFVH